MTARAGDFLVRTLQRIGGVTFCRNRHLVPGVHVVAVSALVDWRLHRELAGVRICVAGRTRLVVDSEIPIR